MLINIIVLAVVAGILFLCVRSFAKGDECSSCSSSAGCTAHKTGDGSCAAAHDMIAHAEAAFGDKK